MVFLSFEGAKMPHYHTALSTSADTDLHKGRGDPELRRVFLSLLSAAETADQQGE